MEQSSSSSTISGIPSLEDSDEETPLTPVTEPGPAVPPPCSVLQDLRPMSPEPPWIPKEDIYIQIPSNMIFDEIDNTVHDQDQVLSNLDPEDINDAVLNPEIHPITAVQPTQGPFVGNIRSALHDPQLDGNQSDLSETLPSDGSFYSMELHLLSNPQLHPRLISTPVPVTLQGRDSLSSLDDNLNLHRVATFDDDEALEDFFFAKKSSSSPSRARKSIKERDGRKVQQLEARRRKDEDMVAKIGNIERCRKYRRNRKKKLQGEETELEQLERKNWKLKSKEQEFTERISKLRVYYLSAIKNGRFKCCAQDPIRHQQP